MLTALELENFKGIAKRQRVDFAPLTLLFGANSAGKSTILQALIYLHELVEHGTADVDRTELGGNIVELGGFARLVHRHDTSRPMVLRVEFATPENLDRFRRDSRDFPFPDLDDEIESAWLELTIRFSTASTFHGPLIERAVIGVGNESEPLVWLETGPSLREGEPLHARVNLGHPLIAEAALEVTDAWEQIAVPEGAWPGATTAQGESSGSGSRKRVGIGDDSGMSDGSRDDPGFGDSSGKGRSSGYGTGLADGSGFGDGRSLPVFAVSRARPSALPPYNEALRVISFGEDSPETATATAQLRTFLEMVVLGTTAQLAAFLRDAIYIGPLRTIPPRNLLYEHSGPVTSWADGLAAWDLLLADRVSLVERTNLWLRRLGAGCQVLVQQLLDGSADAEEVSYGNADKTVRRLLLDTGAGSFVLPSEVGAGISQVMPIVVAALEGRTALESRGVLCLLEQPEIHVHPALQVGLGDLFIDAATREGRRRIMLVETHSEHLILRILRRIRETTEKELPENAPPFSREKLSVIYVESQPEGVRIRRLNVDDRGEFTDRWPKGFFAERMEELL